MPAPSRDEYLTIAGTVVIGTKAAWCTDMQMLYNEEHRGQDRLVPGSVGVVANPRRLSLIIHSLPLIITGAYDSDGLLQANPHQALRDNIAEIRTVTAPVSSGDGTRTVVWTRPDASTVTASCHVGPLRIGEKISSHVVRAVLDLSIPAGTWT